MTGVTGIPDDVLERAVEAAAKADYEVLYGNPDTRGPWEEQSDDFRDVFRSDVRTLVTAALGEVVPNVQAAAWVEGYDAAAKQHPTTSFLGARNPYAKGGKS